MDSKHGNLNTTVNAGNMALGSTSCRGQRHGVGTGGERGTERRGGQKGTTDRKGNVQVTAKGEGGGGE